MPFLTLLVFEELTRECRDAPDTATMDDLRAIQQKMTGWVAQLEAVTPGSGCYINEVRYSVNG